MNALIGCHQSNNPKIVYSTLFSERQALWRDGYSVDAIPVDEARAIEAAWSFVA